MIETSSGARIHQRFRIAVAIIVGMLGLGCTSTSSDSVRAQPLDANQEIKLQNQALEDYQKSVRDYAGTLRPGLNLPKCPTPQSSPIRVTPPSQPTPPGGTATYTVELDRGASPGQVFLIFYDSTSELDQAPRMSDPVPGGATSFELKLKARVGANDTTIGFTVLNTCGKGTAFGTLEIR